MNSVSQNDTSRKRHADIAVIVFALILPTLVTLLYFVLLSSWPGNIQQLAYGLGKTVQFALPVIWVFWVGRSKFQFSLPTRRGLLVNFLFGLAVAGTMLLLYHSWLKPAGLLSQNSQAAAAICAKVKGFGLTSVWLYAAMGIFYSLVHSGMEEYYWRWFVFGRLRHVVSLRGAIVISAIGFMSHHVLVLATYFGWTSFATWFFSISVAVGGGVWAWLYNRYDSLYGVWLGHLLVDAAIFLIGYDLVGHLLTG